ncbi:hypothetical protein AB7321_07195 [Providencia rettgeri]
MNLSSQLDVLLCANSGSTRKLTHENANDVHLNGFNHRQLPLFAQTSRSGLVMFYPTPVSSSLS